MFHSNTRTVRLKAELEIMDVTQEKCSVMEALGLVIRLDSLQDGVKMMKVGAANVVALKTKCTSGPE